MRGGLINQNYFQHKSRKIEYEIFDGFLLEASIEILGAEYTFCFERQLEDDFKWVFQKCFRNPRGEMKFVKNRLAEMNKEVSVPKLTNLVRGYVEENL